MANPQDATLADEMKIGIRKPGISRILLAVALCLIFVAATRLPLARTTAFDFDEAGYLIMIQEADFPKHHTLFLA